MDTLGNMDTLTFIAELAKALAWPAVAAVGLYMFGGELVRLLKEVTKIKFGNLEVDRQIKAAGVELTIAESQSEPAVATLNDHDDADVLTASAVVSPDIKPVNLMTIRTEPVAAALLAWANVEKALSFVLGRNNFSDGTRDPNLVTALPTLFARGLIDTATWAALTNLREVRNRLAHGGISIDSAAAAEYVDNAERIINLLLKSRPKQSDK